MDAIQFLKQQHRKAKASFSKLLVAPPAERGGLWKELRPEPKVHEEIEEACLYGPLEGAGPSDARLAAWVSDRHAEEVQRVGDLIEKTERLDPRGERWLAAVRQIHTALERHIKHEEGDVFPRIGREWDTSRLAKAGEQMSEMKSEKAGRR
jgi:hemerythrin-like domain-containing protein